MGLNTYGLLIIPVTGTGVVPSVYVRLQGDVPVKAILTGVAVPLHTVALPLIIEVGRGLIVTVAVPLLSPACETQLASLNAVTV